MTCSREARADVSLPLHGHIWWQPLHPTKSWLLGNGAGAEEAVGGSGLSRSDPGRCEVKTPVRLPVPKSSDIVPEAARQSYLLRVNWMVGLDSRIVTLNWHRPDMNEYDVTRNVLSEFVLRLVQHLSASTVIIPVRHVRPTGMRREQLFQPNCSSAVHMIRALRWRK